MLSSFHAAYAPVLLGKRATRLAKEYQEKTSDPEKGQVPPQRERIYRTVFQTQDRTWQAIFAKSLVRPFAMFAREPIIQVIGLYMALVYGIFYRKSNLFHTLYFFASVQS